ncbi:MAG: hypothetical protein LBM94_01745 [Propionibacteriaceae bacterium]|jgi:hypothetical protein|nr:hypothetical protein [Propionibacteriaceae bacterium]
MDEDWILPPEAELLSPENRQLVENYIVDLLYLQFNVQEDDGGELVDVSTVMHIDALRQAYEESHPLAQ